VILDYKLPSGSIKSVNMISRLNSMNDDYNTTLNYESDISNKSMGFSLREANSNTDVGVNSLDLTNDLDLSRRILKLLIAIQEIIFRTHHITFSNKTCH